MGIWLRLAFFPQAVEPRPAWHTGGNRRPWTLAGFRIHGEREARSQSGPMMAAPFSSAFVLEPAIGALVARWRLSPSAASDALLEAAAELGVEIGELAALVLAFEHQQRVQRQRPVLDGPDGFRKPALFVVEDEPEEALRLQGRESSGATNSRVLRDSGRLRPLPKRQRPQSVLAFTPTPPVTAPAFDTDRSASGEDHLDDDQSRHDPPIVWSVPDPEFSSLEAEIVFLLTCGLSNQQIADAIFLSINSVKTHIRSAYRKMGVETRSQALLWGIDHGLRPPGAGRTWERFAPPEACSSARVIGER